LKQEKYKKAQIKKVKRRLLGAFDPNYPGISTRDGEKRSKKTLQNSGNEVWCYNREPEPPLFPVVDMKQYLSGGCSV
jgi:hypothetical protein